MECKVFKHKTLPNTWGVLQYREIWLCSTPQLYPITVELDDLLRYWIYPGSVIDVSNWDFVTITITLKE